MPTGCRRRNWEGSLLPSSSRRLSPTPGWSRASTTWGLPNSTRIRPYRAARELCSWRATMTLPPRRLVLWRKSSVSRRSNWAAFRKADCLCRRAGIPGVGSSSRTWSSSTDGSWSNSSAIKFDIPPSEKGLTMTSALNDQSLYQIFRAAHTPNGWTDRPVEDATVRAIYDLMKWGPTSANSSPARFVWVRSTDGKATLAGLAADLNKAKILQAPATVIIGHDLDFA